MFRHGKSAEIPTIKKSQNSDHNKSQNFDLQDIISGSFIHTYMVLEIPKDDGPAPEALLFSDDEEEDGEEANSDGGGKMMLSRFQDRS